MHKYYKYFELILGIILISFAFNLFINPLNIVIGGTSGISIIMNALFGINPSTFIAIFYLSMLVLSLLVFGFNGTKKVLIGSLLYPLCVNLFKGLPNYIELDYSNKLLMYITAAVLIGIGNGLVYKNDFLTGGTDIIKKIINNKFKIEMGKSAFVFDALIVITGGIIFGLDSVLYAIIILYISSKITDRVILGISTRKMFYIMTEKPDIVKKYIIEKLNYRVVEIDSIGGYTNDKNHILMCVIPTKKYIELKQIVLQIDNKAFFLITDSYHTNYGRKYGVN